MLTCDVLCSCVLSFGVGSVFNVLGVFGGSWVDFCLFGWLLGGLWGVLGGLGRLLGHLGGLLEGLGGVLERLEAVLGRRVAFG